ncbi:MAG: biotin transporter BioY [Candidatus Omnitrophica bacterium]|nr:biotin transporter BioY [Candidatus Omnitrophota bacterium]MCM8793528.1 biotin transporter BioY [Candidatus Omnitrophota bacterium]
MDNSLIKGKIVSMAKQEVIKSTVLTKALGVVIFIIFTALGAYIYLPLPFTPVPITLQSFFVILSGAILGPGAGFLSQLGYLSLGVVGLPVFSAGRAGILHLFGPTGGYLWGFLFSAWLVGKLVYRKRRNCFFLFSSFVIGIFTIYLFGIIQLSLFLKGDFFRAFSLGALPFIFPDLLKILLATWGYSSLKK